MLPRRLLLLLALLGLALTATAIDGPFTIDENNYLVTALGLRQGVLTVPGTGGLPPSAELLYFDPAAALRDVTTTPVASTAPPLYAPLAVPFLLLGWRGLVLLNTLSLLATGTIVFVLTKRFSSASDAPAIAAVAVTIGAYFVEYAQGVWPHMLAVSLVAGALLLASDALESNRPSWAASAAGLLVAAATGVRYQNAFVLACLGLGLVLLARQRVRATGAFAAGASLPLIASSFANHARLGSWNPMSKGPGYLPDPARLGGIEGSRGFVGDFLTLAWARIVDYSAAPTLAGTSHASFHAPHPVSGAYVMVTAVKKAWLQSAPWILLALIILILAWLPARHFARAFGGAPQRQLRLLSLVVLPTLAMFSASGINRTDGLCFNQRYFCELVPAVSVALAWGVGGIGQRRRSLVAGALTGGALVLLALTPHHLMPARHYMVMYVPLGLAVLLAVAWVLERRRRPETGAPGSASASGASSLLAFTVAASLAWGACVHVGDDLHASRILRESRRDYLRQLRPYLTDRSAVFAGGAVKDALGPLQIDMDVVIATPGIDRAATAKDLLEAFLAQGRRVFLLPNAMPTDMMNEVLGGRKVRYLGQPPLLIEVGPR